METQPKLIVITPVRNEAWVLDAFLTSTSRWADHIIIVDQHSTDGSVEIAEKYPKVTLINNPDPEWHEMEARTMLLNAAANIPGDKIIFGLDADEMLSTGFEKTQGWKNIIQSKPNTIFCFRWLNVFDNFHTVEYSEWFAEWACHFDESIDIVEEYKKREKHSVHASRVPCLNIDQASYVDVEDIRFVHLAKLNKDKTRNKNDFYQVTWRDKNEEKKHPISFYRGYSEFYPQKLRHLNKDISLASIDIPDSIIKAKISASDYGKHYIDEIKRVVQRDDGTKKYENLCIWDNPYLIEAGIVPHRPWYIKLLHIYLRFTQHHHKHFVVRGIDKMLKQIPL